MIGVVALADHGKTVGNGEKLVAGLDLAGAKSPLPTAGPRPATHRSGTRSGGLCRPVEFATSRYSS
ncbi:MAG: hypothetical protein WBL55_26495, partial [Xanthobacteraceae bacterium]